MPAVRGEGAGLTVKLSIAIPTYNGSLHIGEAIDSILSQLGRIDEEVEIVISDNASTDRTPEIVREYQERYSLIKYFRNEGNLGPDRNYDLAVRRARGEFVWLFSDDDRIRDGGIRRVLEVIDKYPSVAAIFVNYESHYRLNCSQDCLCSNGDDFFDKTRFKNSFASSNVIRKAEWELVDTSKYFHTNWIHVGVLIEVVGTAPAFIVCDRLVQPVGGWKWGESGTFFIVDLSLVKIIKGMSKYNYGENIIKKTISGVLRSYFVYIPLAKARGLRVNPDLIREVYSLCKGFPSFWIIDLPLLLVPNAFYKAAYRVCKTRVLNGACKKLISKTC